MRDRVVRAAGSRHSGGRGIAQCGAFCLSEALTRHPVL